MVKVFVLTSEYQYLSMNNFKGPHTKDLTIFVHFTADFLLDFLDFDNVASRENIFEGFELTIPQ